MKITRRDAKLLIILSGLLIFVCLYMLVYTKLEEKTEIVNQKIAELKPQAEELEKHYLKLDFYQKSIEQNRVTVMDGMLALPADVQEEDFLSYLLAMEQSEEIHIESVTFDPDVVFSQFDATIQKDGKDEVVPAAARTHTAVMSAYMSYPQAKRVLDYIYDSDYRTVLDNVALTFNSETGGLLGTFTIRKFSMEWPLGVYTPEPVPPANIGLRDLFGTS